MEWVTCVCVWIGAGGVGGEWLTGLGLGFTNSGETWDMCLCFGSDTYGRNGATPNFQILSQTCQFHHGRLESLEHFNVPFLYIILSTTASFLEDTILFLHGLFFYVVYISIFFIASTQFDGLF